VTVAPGYPSYDIKNPAVVEQLREQAEKILEEQAEKIEREGGQGRREAPEDSRTV
jgi:hypothetical protein